MTKLNLNEQNGKLALPSQSNRAGRKGHHGVVKLLPCWLEKATETGISRTFYANIRW